VADDTTTIDAEDVPEGPSIDINDEMSKSFVDYAMSVIVSRALPDVRDGLKPVQRRIIYAMDDMGVSPTSAHRKSATVVGEVIGKYHPHSNDAIYDALVRMGQDFSLRYPLIEPQGNFGTPDDPPAAMRYTECRMEQIAMALLDGIDENTVEFADNYSGEETEPVVLPSRFPNLLVNGSQGIAVGMATNIPPHNLGEVIDACMFGLDNPDAGPEDYLSIVKGPDFPTGGYIVGTKGAKDALVSGRGSIKVRAVTDVQEIRKGRTAIVVTELPYQVSQDRLLAKIAELVNDKKINGIADLRNESDSRTGMRLVIELKRDAVPQVVLNQLLKMTQLQDSFGVNTVALVDGVPRTLNIAELVGYYLDHQMEVIERRTQFRLDKAQARAHIVEGLIIAVDNIDEVVAIIRASEDTASARVALMERFELSEVQATEILNMPLRRLTSLETNKLREEYEELKALIEELESILADPSKRRSLIADELTEIREKYADERKSRIVPDEGDMSLEDLIADDELVVTVSANGYVKSVAANTYRAQGRGGRGVKGAQMREDDVLTHVLHTTAHAYLLFFTNSGKVHRIKAHEIPRQQRTSKGVLAQSVLPLEPEEKIRAIVDTRDYETSKFLVIVTRKGQAKKTAFGEYDSRNATLIAINLAQDDEVVEVRTTSGENELLVFTRNGQGIRFAESELRPMGRATQGVRGIRLRDGDEVVAAAANVDGEEVLLLTSGGYGKRTAMDQFPLQKRGGIGVKAIKLTRVRGTLVGAKAVDIDSQIFVTSSDGIVIRMNVKTISRQKRDASGVKVMNLGDGTQLTAFTRVPKGEEEETSE
jgi:DNA gyrase subunit A